MLNFASYSANLWSECVTSLRSYEDSILMQSTCSTSLIFEGIKKGATW